MGYPSNPAISDSAAPGQDGNGLRGARESDEVTLAYFDVTQPLRRGPSIYSERPPALHASVLAIFGWRSPRRELSASGRRPEALSRFGHCADVLAWGAETRRAASWVVGREGRELLERLCEPMTCRTRPCVVWDIVGTWPTGKRW